MWEEFGAYRIYVRTDRAIVRILDITENNIEWERTDNHPIDFETLNDKLNLTLNELLTPEEYPKVVFNPFFEE